MQVVFSIISRLTVEKRQQRELRYFELKIYFFLPGVGSNYIQRRNRVVTLHYNTRRFYVLHLHSTTEISYRFAEYGVRRNGVLLGSNAANTY